MSYLQRLRNVEERCRLLEERIYLLEKKKQARLAIEIQDIEIEARPEG